MLTFEARGPGFKYQPREIQPTLYFVLGPPDVIPLPVDLSSVVECLGFGAKGLEFKCINLIVRSI